VAVRNLYYSNTAYDAEFDMISGSITNNTAGNLGGGIYADGEANTPNKTKVYIGVENCTGEGPKHTSTHTDKTHPVVTANNADIGGGVAVEAGATVTVYCANVNGNSATNDGRGDNVYSAGDALVLHDAATVGETTNHQLVVVSGIFQKAAQAVSVNLHYYQTNLDTTPGNTAQATAGEYFNLPDPSLMWSGNGIFLGWTFNGPTNTASPYVRKPSDYNMTMGTPLQAVDATDGHDDAEDAVHMYAVWAPQSSKITYTGCYIDGTYKSDALVTLESGTYNYNEEQSLFTLPNVEMAGYTFQGWYLYQDEGQNANWGYEKSNMLRLNAGQQLDLGSGHFGDITLIPIYTENEVQISYHVSVPTGGNPSDFGYLTQGGNKINSGYAENVKVVTGKPGAVTAIANYRYIFKGWYADGVLITEDPVLTNAHLRKDAEGQLMSEEYYAVFDYHLDDLVINCAASGFFSGEQNFIYEVWCDDTLVTVVTLRNGESVTVRNLLINKEYTVKMMADWSWRFMGGTAAISKQITLEAGGKSVSFTSNQQRDIWLTHDTFVKTGNG